MSLENLEKNIKEEKKIIEEISYHKSQLEKIEKDPYSGENEKKMLRQVLNSSLERIKILNDTIPDLVKSLEGVKKLDGGKPTKNLEKKDGKDIGKENNFVNLRDEGGEIVSIKKENKNKYLKQLRIKEDILKRLKKGNRGREGKEREGKRQKELMEFKEAGEYAKISNKLFFKLSNNIIKKGKFKELNEDLRQANMPFLTVTYLSMIFFTTLLISIFSLLFFATSFFISFFPPGISPEITLDYVAINLGISLALPLITFFSIYYYPKSEAKSFGDKIDHELPFATIHMSAVAGSGIEPSEIFKIIALGEEYPNTKIEMKKIINQVNVYGFDLVTALKNTARETSSQKLSELLNGVSTTISGGGNLTNFLDERAEGLLYDYRLEREKYNKESETFMDIYIGVVIAAPMILMLLFILMGMTGMGLELGPGALSIIMVTAIAIINIFFLLFLNLKQPPY